MYPVPVIIYPGDKPKKLLKWVLRIISTVTVATDMHIVGVIIQSGSYKGSFLFTPVALQSQRINHCYFPLLIMVFVIMQQAYTAITRNSISILKVFLDSKSLETLSISI
jgi:hypothetical protein